MKILDTVFKISVIFLLGGILLAITYFGFNGWNLVETNQRYAKFSELDGASILDQKTGIVYLFSDKGFNSIDFIKKKLN